ncbi:MAG TPA: hypothetical protein VK508_05435 [Cyclobacteriaceae bacterium]|nr:hypothetical protein [Cyclobacteriaceae bacterium]
MKYILLVALVALLCTEASSQNDSGVFLTIKCSKKIPRHTEMVTFKQVCLASSPIIIASDFESITDLRQNNEKIHFDIGLSAKAFKTFQQLKANLPEATFALVVDKEVFSVFPASDLAVNRTFRFEGVSKDRPVFSKIQEKLKALINTGDEKKL